MLNNIDKMRNLQKEIGVDFTIDIEQFCSNNFKKYFLLFVYYLTNTTDISYSYEYFEDTFEKNIEKIQDIYKNFNLIDEIYSKLYEFVENSSFIEYVILRINGKLSLFIRKIKDGGLDVVNNYKNINLKKFYTLLSNKTFYITITLKTLDKNEKEFNYLLNNQEKNNVSQKIVGDIDEYIRTLVVIAI